MTPSYDTIVIGMGPGAIFFAYEMIQKNQNKKILLVEQGKRVEDRNCPIETIGKLSLYNIEDDDFYVGGELHKYVGVEETKKLIDYTDQIYLDFGADPKLEGTKYKNEINEIKKKAKKEEITLIDIPIRHLGTEKAHELYKKLEKYLEEHNIDLMFETEVKDLIIENNEAKGIIVHNIKENSEEKVYGKNIIIAVGRKGANWLVDMCNAHNIKTEAGVVDIGVRYELSDEVMKDINTYMYEGKFIGYPGPFKDKVRTFCQNPSGFVSSEVYDEGINLVNGHSYKDKKSTHTNLAILVSHHFNYPFDKPIEYGRNIAKNINELGNGNIVVQRLGDIYRGKRTWDEELQNNKIKPTLKSAVAGDITFALGYRTMTDILQFIRSMDKIVEGFANPENLLYAPEIKFYSNKVVIDHNFETSVKGLYSIGDGGGMTRGLMMASASGVQMARNLINKGV